VPRRLLVVLAPLLLLGPVACGSDVIRAASVADGAEQALEEQLGLRPEVSCPDDVAATVGATARCTAQPPGEATTYGVTVTVTEIEDEEAVYAVTVDDDAAGT
jgi:hypothetical protein